MASAVCHELPTVQLSYKIMFLRVFLRFWSIMKVFLELPILRSLNVDESFGDDGSELIG